MKTSTKRDLSDSELLELWARFNNPKSVVDYGLSFGRDELARIRAIDNRLIGEELAAVMDGLYASLLTSVKGDFDEDEYEEGDRG